MYRILASAVLALLGLVLLAWPDLAHRVAGYKPLVPPGPELIDDPPPFDEGAALRFFEERNEIDLTVPRDMTAGELLRLYQIDFPHVRRQIAQARGDQILSDRALLRRGERYHITLTPPAEGVP